MIDSATYLKLHPESAENRKSRTYAEGPDLEAEAIKEIMDQEDPPSTDIINIFPSVIVGFNLRLKKWGTCFRILRLQPNNPPINRLGVV